MLPITGPFQTEIDNDLLYEFKRTSKQVKPYNLVLPYTLRESYRMAKSGSDLGIVTGFRPSSSVGWVLSYTQTGIGMVDNVAYAKFRGKMMDDSASVGILLGEYSASADMIKKRAKQVYELALALRSRDFKRAGLVATRDISKIPRGSHGKGSTLPLKDVSSLWLEWSWGWRPMIEDIVKGLEVLVSPPLRNYARGSHNRDYDLENRKVKTEGYDSSSGYWVVQDYVEHLKFKYTGSTGAQFHVTNHNVALANRLGLINVAGIAWSVYPFSFLVDKYVNIGQMINSVTDLYGFQVENAWTNRKLRGTHTLSGQYRYYTDSSKATIVKSTDIACVNALNLKDRTTGLLGPTFSYREASIGSIGEAASYIALVVQILTK